MRIDKARDYVVDNLQYALNPSSIAVVGASRYPSKVGNKVVAELLEWSHDCVDLVFVAVPAHLVTAIVEDAIEIKAKVLVIATSAFKEIGREDLQNKITLRLRENKIPLIGPNLVGMGSPYNHFNCGFIPYLPVPGPIAMISQSGANLLAALGTIQEDHFGMSFFVGLGNKAAVDFSEFIEYAQ